MIPEEPKMLLALLSNKDLNVRNFFGHGHGHVPGLNGLGGVPAVGIMGLHASEIKRKLKNRRYRFVFLSGCQTASDDLFSAFGAASFELPHGYPGEVGSYDDPPLNVPEVVPDRIPRRF